MEKNKSKKKKLNLLPLKIVFGVIFTGILIISYFFLFSRKWSLYLYSPNNKGEHAVFVNEYSTQDACVRRGRERVGEKIQLDKKTLATDFLCGKYCLEIPATNLNISQVFCSSRTTGYNGEYLRK